MADKPIMNKQRPLMTGIVITILGFCLIFLVREIAIKIERDNCYHRLSEELSTTASYGVIRGEIYSRLQNKLKLGMNRAEVLTLLQDTAPISTRWKMSRSDGGYNEYIILEACYFRRNGFPFLVVYSRDETFEKIVNYIND